MAFSNRVISPAEREGMRPTGITPPKDPNIHIIPPSRRIAAADQPVLKPSQPTDTSGTTSSGGGGGGGGGGVSLPNIPPIVERVQSAPPYAGLTTFDATNNLRRTQINPVPTTYNPVQQQALDLISGVNAPMFRSVGGPDFSGALAEYDKAGANIDQATVGDLRQIASGTYENSPEALRARQIAMQFLEGLGSTPNRTDIAQQKLDIFEERAKERLDEDLQTTGRANAALGRLGSGMVRDDLRGAVTKINNEKALLRRDLAAETAGLELNDLLAKLDAGTRTGAQFRTEDLNDAGMKLTLRNEDRSERAAHANRESEQAQLALARANALQLLGGNRADLSSRSHAAEVYERDAELNNGQFGAELGLRKAGGLAGIDSQAFGQQFTNRNELRSERDNQNQQAQQEINNRIAEAELQLRQGQIDQDEFFRFINSLLATA